MTDTRSFSNDLGEITVSTLEDGKLSIRSYEYKDIDATVEMYRVYDNKSAEFEFPIGTNAVVRVATPEVGFKEYTVDDDIPQSSCYYIDSDNYHYWIYTPKSYKILENFSLEYLPKSDGKIKVYEDRIVVDTKLIGFKKISDFMIVESSDPLFDWGKEDKKVENFMKYYNLDGDGHWCYDGYYYKAASSYVPSGDNVYYFCVDSYIIGSFIAGMRYDGCKFIVPAMIDTMLMHQTDEGYIPTYSFSTWLNEDYGIEAGFYDTRFNTDFWQYVLDAYNKSGGDIFCSALEKYGQFFLKHADKNQIKTESGYFVSDYYQPESGALTHASLNHNIAEVELCIKLSELFNDSAYKNVAYNIIDAIEDTYEDWIKPNNNLEYAICPNMSFAYEDYPYLTYNDLYNIQVMLEERGLGRNEAFDKLMSAKKAWMDANNITEYKK